MFSSWQTEDRLTALQADGRNAVVAFFGSGSSPLGGTPEADWTEDADTGYGSPNTGIGVYHRLWTTDNSLVITRTAVNWASAMLELHSLPPTEVGGDVMLITGAASGTFEDKNVGAGKLVPVSGLTLGGLDAANFSLPALPLTMSADITPLGITVTAVSGSKVYDGTTSSAGEPRIVPALVAPDTENFSESYDNRNAGTGKTLTPAGSVNDGNSGANYSVTFANNTMGQITPRTLTVTADDQSRGYGQPNPIFTLTYSGFVNDENESVLREQPTGEITASIDSPAGQYAIRVVGGLDTNYEFIRVDGTLTVVGAPPVILSLTGAGTTNVVLTWSAISNRTYRLIYTDNLQSRNWISHLFDLKAQGSTAMATNMADTAKRRFYRIMLLP